MDTLTITEHDARRQLDDALLGQGMSDSTRNTYGAALSRWWRWALEQGHDPTLPTLAAVREWSETEASGVSTRDQCKATIRWWCTVRGVEDVSAGVGRPEKNSRRPRRALTHDQAAQVVEAAERCGTAGTAVLFIMLTGARRSEAATMQWERIDWTGETVRLWRPKQDAFHDVPLHPLLAAYLDPVRQERGWLFIGRNHGHISYGTINEWVKRVANEAGDVDWLHPHALRRTAATFLYELENDIMAVKEFLGHAKITTTQQYINVGTASVRRQWARFGFDTAARSAPGAAP